MRSVADILAELEEVITEKVKAELFATLQGKPKPKPRSEAFHVAQRAIKKVVAKAPVKPPERAAKPPVKPPERTGRRRRGNDIERLAESVLAYIKGHPNCKISDIAAAHGLTSTDVSFPLKKLKEKKAVVTHGEKFATRYQVVHP